MRSCLRHAAAGDLHEPEVIAAQARRMLQGSRGPGAGGRVRRQLARFPPFRGNRHRRSRAFPAFTDELRQAMFEEPVRFLLDVFQTNRPILDLLYAKRHVRESRPGQALRHPGVGGRRGRVGAGRRTPIAMIAAACCRWRRF